MISSYFYPGEEERESISEFALRLRSDNPADYLESLRSDISRFLSDAGSDADRRFGEEFISYFSPEDQTVSEWLTELWDALAPQA